MAIFLYDAKSIGNNGQQSTERPRNMFADYMKPPRQEEKEEEDEVELEDNEGLTSSRANITNTAVPPWIEKLRKNRK